MKRTLVTVLACAMLLGMLIPPWAMSQQNQPAQPAGGAQPAAAPQPAGQRSPQDIQMDLRAASNELRGALTGPNVLFDAKLREQQGPRAVPAIKKMLSLFDEMAKAQPGEKEEIERAKLDFNTMLVVFGDAAAKTDLEKQAAGKGEPAEGAQGALLLAEWWKAGKDEVAQTKVLDNVQKLAKANPQSDMVAITLMKMSQVGAANEKLADRARDIVTTELKGEIAQQISQQANSEKKLKQLAGKPLEIAGTTVDGKKFSTKDWKGKVILVDFWATWCGPCIAELPKVKKIYKDYHDKGLEILGVSCDSEADELKGFITKNPDMPWPQLFDAQQNPKLQWHPLAKEYGINGIPTMFLIDKKGVVRTVEARQDFEELIPKMLEEK